MWRGGGSLSPCLTYFGQAAGHWGEGGGASGRGAAGEGGLVRAGALNPGNVSSGVSGLPHSSQRENPLAELCASFQGSQL